MKWNQSWQESGAMYYGDYNFQSFTEHLNRIAANGTRIHISIEYSNMRGICILTIF